MQHILEQLVLRWLGRVALALVLAGMYVPVLMTLLYSFNASPVGTVWTHFSLDGYRNVFAQEGLFSALWASLAIGAIASSLSVLAGTLAAMGLVAWRPSTKLLAQGVLALPLVTPDVIIALSLAMFFSALRKSFKTSFYYECCEFIAVHFCKNSIHISKTAICDPAFLSI